MSDYYEAAAMDSATKWQQFCHITLPFLKPMLIILTLLSIGKIFYADFGLFYHLPRQSGQLYPVTNVIDTYVYNGLKVTGNIGMSAASNFYQSVVGFVLVLAANLTVRKIDPEYSLF
ncbi:MAG: ABC transporter permease subunit [Clostridia bacterium]